MPIVLEEIKDVQYITNKDGEKTAIIIPLDENSNSFHKLLTDFIEIRDYKNVNLLVTAEHIFRNLDTLIESIDDPEILDEAGKEIESLMEMIEDKIDLILIDRRKDEATVSHTMLTEELKRDGVL